MTNKLVDETCRLKIDYLVFKVYRKIYDFVFLELLYLYDMELECQNRWWLLD